MHIGNSRLRLFRALVFENRGPQCALLVYVDDATSRLMHLKFVEMESTFDYFQATREYLETPGKPIAFYSDKHGVFRDETIQAILGKRVGINRQSTGVVAVVSDDKPAKNHGSERG